MANDRILTRLEVSEELSCMTSIRDVYDTYKIETVLEEEKQVSIEQFSLAIQRCLVIHMKRIKQNGIRHSKYPLCIKPVIDNNAQNSEFTVDALTSNIPDTFKITKQDDRGVDVVLDSGSKSNMDVIQIKIHFGQDSKYTVFIRETEINLKAQYISNHFNCTKDGLALVEKQIRSIRLCEGQMTESNKIELKAHYNVENFLSGHTCTCIQKKIIRSNYCKLVAPFGYTKEQHCHSCKRMTVTYKTPIIENSKEDLIKEMIPGASDMLLTLIMSQIKNSNNKCSTQNKWDRKIINECLNWYTRSPLSYQQIRQSGLLLLPSPSLLVQYKNTIAHQPGFRSDIFCWMDQEATRMAIPVCGRIGGIIIDEMSIQQKIEIQKKGQEIKLVGFVDMGDESKNIHAIKTGAHTNKIGSHVLQFLFQGLTGFRFPFAHFVSDQVNATDLYILVWEAVANISMYNFEIKYICMDGASSNRSFMKIHFPNNSAISNRMIANCPCNPIETTIFLMDPSHTFKKIRNNIMKSGINQKSTRILTLSNGSEIHWQMWVDAYHWDRCNPLQIHKHLKNEHIYPNQSEKMRNQLAEDVLNGDMLNLMLAYKQFLGQKGSVLNGAIELLKNTAILIDVFRDRRPVNDITDSRIVKLTQVQSWFLHWETHASSKGSIMSVQCHEDLQSTIIGFIELCNYVINVHQGWSVTPAMINSDAIENIFCQQRGKFNGLNTNPTALQYRRNINGVIIGQSAISRKSNAKSTLQMTENFAFSSKKAIHQSSKRKSTARPELKSIKCLRM